MAVEDPFRKTVAFFGAFLSRNTGTKGVVEKISGKLQEMPGVEVQLVSRHSLPFVRAIQMLFHACFGRFDIAHLDVYSGRSFHLSAFCAKILKCRKIPFVVTLRGGRLPEFYGSQASRLRRLIQAAKSAQTPSLYLQDFFEKAGLSLGYVPNPIDLTIFHPLGHAIQRKPFSLLWVRAFDPIYQPTLPVEALHLLRKQFPEARLTMVGPDKGSLSATRRRIKALGLEDVVEIAGPVPNEDLPAYYASHAVFLNTTQYESFGAALLEAAACAIPIVSTSVGEIPYLWEDGSDMFLTKTDSAAAFSEKIRLIFEQPEQAADMAQSARAKAERFSLTPILEQWRVLLISAPPTSYTTMANAQPLRLLFLGNYLSAKRGTIGPSENLAKWMGKEGVRIRTASRYESKILRALDLLLACACTRYDLACADVFTGNIQHILPFLCGIVTLRKKRLVLILHGGQLPDLYESQPERVRRVLKKADLLVTPSPHLKLYFLEKGFSIALIPNAIDLRKFRYAPPNTAVPPKILWIRAFSTIYNPLLAVEILDVVRSRYPGATMTMIGPDGGMLAETRQKIREKGLETAVTLPGPVANDRMLEYHHTHTVLLNTTSFESFGVAILEGASSGIPLVSSRVGSIPLIWENEKEILLVASWEAKAFADAISRLAADPQLAMRMSQNAQKKAMEYGIDWIAPKWLQLLHGILER